MSSQDSYIPLWCKSNFSFLEGASHPEELVETARQLGLAALALTDRDGVSRDRPGPRRARETRRRARSSGARSPSTTARPIVLLAAGPGGLRATSAGCSPAGGCARAKGESRVAWDEVAEHAGGPDRAVGRRAEPARAARPSRDRVAHAAARGLRRPALRAGRAPSRGRRGRARRPRLRRRAARLRARRSSPRVEVLYHAPARRPLQDVLTCIRHGVTARRRRAGCCGPTTEHALQAPAAFAQLFADDPARRRAHAGGRRALHLLARRAALPLPLRAAARRHDDRASGCDELTLRRAPASATATRCPPTSPRAAREGARPHRRARLRGYFLTMWEIVRFCRRAGHPLPGARLGRQLRRLLLPGHHRRRSRADGPALRALPLARAGRAAGHRPRHRARAARGGDPARLREVRPRPRRDGRQRHPLPRPLGRARRGQGARPRRRPQLDRLAKLASHYGDDRPPRASRSAGLDPDGAGARAPAAPGRRDPGLPAPPLDPPRRLPARPRAGARPGAHRERHHGGPHRHPVGQGRRRGARPVQGRPARPRRAHPPAPRLRPAARAPRRSTCRMATHPARTTRPPSR